MTIAVGDKLPAATFKVPTSDGATEMSTADVFAGKKVILFGVPGAFTPTCSNNHLPGFLENAEAIRARGVDTIACLSVNDHFVLKAWANQTGAKDKILFLADGAASFTRDIGLDVDMSSRGFGIRSRRFAAIVEDGVVTSIEIEEAPGSAEVSGAAAVIARL